MSNPASTAVMGDKGEVVADGTAIARTTGWTFNPKIGESAWGDSDSAGYTLRKGARKDGSGSCEGKYDDTTPQSAVVEIGDEPELVLWITQTLYYYMPCVLITGFSLSVNMDSKEVVGWSCDFGCSGIFYRPGQSGATPKTYPA